LDAVHIQTVIKDFLAERFDISADKITDNTAIRDLGLDSMMMLEVMLELEDRLGIKLKDLSMPANPMLRDVVALVERNQSAQKRRLAKIATSSSPDSASFHPSVSTSPSCCRVCSRTAPVFVCGNHRHLQKNCRPG